MENLQKWAVVRKDGSTFYLSAETQQAALAEFKLRHPGARVRRVERMRKISPSEWVRLSQPPQMHKNCPFCHKEVPEKRWGLHAFKCAGGLPTKPEVLQGGRMESNRRTH